jgi:hypothetical protein
MQFVHNVYERKIGKGKIDEDMWGEYVRIYRDAVSKGYGMSHNTTFDRSSRMADQIEHNIEVFSAFKTHNQQELMAQKMLKDGKRVGFDEFKAAVEPIARHHNGAWLQTEYATASLRAAQAADWQEFEQNADIFPNLKWMPTTSARPDEAVHGTYSGLTGPQVVLPIHDPFWDNHRPGDRWNCKCGLEPTDEPSLHQTNKQAAARAEQGKPTGQRGLQANPGKKGEVFDTKHPYFPKNCKQCPFFSVSTGVKNASTTPHCQSCSKPPKAEEQPRSREEKISIREKAFEKYKNDPDYIDVQFNPKNGALLARHKDHNDGKKAEVFFKNLTPNGKGLTGIELEDHCIRQLYNMGNAVVTQPKGEVMCRTETGDKHRTSLDLIFNGERVDIKSIIASKKYYTSCLMHKNKQISKWNSENPDDHANGVMLYFYDPNMFSKNKVKDGITHYLNTLRADGKHWYGKANNLTHVYCVVNGVDKVYKFDVK